MAAYVPATVRLLEWARRRWELPPVAVGLAAGVTLALAAVAALWVSGSLDAVLRGEQSSLATRATATLFVLIGYVPMAQYYLRRWSAEHIAAIQERFRMPLPSRSPSRRALAVAGTLGSITFYLSFFHQTDAPLAALDPRRWSFDFALPLLGGFLLGWLNFRLIYELCWHAKSVSDTAPSITDLDLLDTAAVRPYAQQGVRSSLLIAGFLSISANLWLDPGSPLVGPLLTVGMFTAAAIVVLILPTWKIHTRMRENKDADLAAVRSAIRRRRRLGERSPEDAAQLRADLALEQRLMTANVWPMDAGSYGRVLLYMLLGLGSWIGAALIERLLEQTL